MKSQFKKMIISFALISVIVLCGCKAGRMESEVLAGGDAALYKDMLGDTPLEEMPGASPEDNSDGTEEPLPEITVDEKDVFSLLSSKLEHWEDFYQVDMNINPDGSFTGKATISIKHETKDYNCEFTGQLAEPVRSGNGIYKTRVEDLQWSKEYREEKQGSDGLFFTHYYLDYDEFMLLFHEEAVGISEGDEWEIILPGSPLNEISEECFNWLQRHGVASENRRALPRRLCLFYNVTENVIYNTKLQEALNFMHFGGQQGDVNVVVNMDSSHIYVSLFTEEELDTFYDINLKRDAGQSTMSYEEQQQFGYSIYGEVYEDDQTDFTMVWNQNSSSPDSSTSPCRLHIDYLDDKKETIRITITCENGGDLTAWGGTSDGKFSAELTLDPTYSIHRP